MNRILVIAATASLLGAAGNAEGVEIRKTILARTGDPVPALGPGVTWQAFYTGLTDAVINSAGHIAFAGVVRGTGIDATNANVLMAGPIGGPYRLVARSGVAAPGAPDGVVFSDPVFPFLADNGRVLFYSTLTGPNITTANDTGMWMEADVDGAAPTLVFREGGAAPGYPSLTATFDVRSVAFQPQQRLIAMVATLAGAGVINSNASVLYRSNVGSPATLEVAARAGDLIPTQLGISYGTFGSLCFAGPPGTLDLIVRNSLTGGAVTSGNDGSLLLFQGGGPGVVAREGSPIPGQTGLTYNQLLSAFALPTGEIAYFATMTGLTTPNGCIWIGSRLGGSGGNPRPLGFKDTPAPGFPAGSTFVSSSLDRYDVSSAGRAVYGATCAGASVVAANDTALFTEGPGGPGSSTLIAREGSIPPGLTAPALFSGFVSPLFNSYAINARHQTAFFAYAPGAAPDPTADTGLWIADQAGNVQLVAHRSQPFALTPTETKTLVLVGYRAIGNGAQLPARRWFLDDGRLITSFAFNDSTSALVLLHVDPPALCRADFNGDGNDTLQDLFDFLAAWFQRDARADVNGVDGVSVQDLFDFLVFWFAGCP